MLVGIARSVGRVLRALIVVAIVIALVAGLPWALGHYIGWPLPDHLPTWAEIHQVLLGSMTVTVLLDALACVCWISWAAFTIHLGRCTVDAARDLAEAGFDTARLPTLSPTRPVHALAGILVGAIMVGLIGHRPTAPVTELRADTVVVTAPAWHTAALSAPSLRGWVVVRAPENGVHDSLWRIAQRTLGDGARWPEIFDLNHGKPQPHGHTFTNPSLIFPGEELCLPADVTVSPPQDPTPPPEPPPPKTTVPPPSHQPSSPATPAPAGQHTPEAPTTATNPPPATQEPRPGWGPDVFVSLGLAAAVSTALVVLRRRHSNRYRPGSGDRSQPGVAPVVYQLHRAHLRAEADSTEFDLDGDPPDKTECPRPKTPPPVTVGETSTGSRTTSRSAITPELGMRDGREIALNLATARGLGLVGAGATAAARALLVTALTASTTHSPTGPSSTRESVLVPADNLVELLGQTHLPTSLPAALRVVADLDEALTTLEAEIVVRAVGRSQTQPGQPWPAMMLVARPPAHAAQRLQAVLDNGAPFGITGLLLGQWQPGVTAYVRADGTISATSPGLGEALRGTRMFRLGEDDTVDLLALLRQIDTSPSEMSGIHADQAAGADLEVTDLTDQTVVDNHNVSDQDDGETGNRLEPDADLATCVTAPSSSHTDAPTADAVPVPITITVLGPLRVHWNPHHRHTAATGTDRRAHEITDALQPRTRELLALLALHPHGITREALVSALWADTPPARPTNALHTALARLRHAITLATDHTITDISLVSSGRYQLDPTTVSVDYWHFAAAVATRRAAATERERVNAYRTVVDAYTGPLAEGMTTEWIEPAREAIRRDAIDAVAALARSLVTTDPQQTLDLLEVARAFDPHNELLYRDIMRLQERLGHLDAIPRTLSLLTTRLAEVDETPSPQALELAARLDRRNDAPPPTAGAPMRRQPDGSQHGRRAAS